MKNRTLVTVPFNPAWMDENGYLTKAWSAMDDYPHADRLVGTISQPGDQVKIPEGALEASRLDHNAVGGFVIGRERITHTFLYHKPRLDPNGLVHLGSITIPAVAKITPGVINVYHHIQEARGHAALLESWHLTAKCRGNGVMNEQEWVMTERAVNLAFSPSHLIQSKHETLEMLPVNGLTLIKTLVHHLNQLAIRMNIITDLSVGFAELQRKASNDKLNVVASPKERNWWYRWYLETKDLIMGEGLSDELLHSTTLATAQLNFIRRKFDAAIDHIRQGTH